MSPEPDSTRKALINFTISSLKAAGIWSKLEVLYFFAASTSQAALLNWVSSSFNATVVGAPTFTADRGYAGNGTTTYLTSNWNPANSLIYLQDSASFGCYLNAGTDTASNSAVAMGAQDAGPQGFLGPWRVANVIGGRINQASTVDYPITVATRLGFSALSRTGATAAQAYRGLAPSTVSAIASSGRANRNLYLCGGNVAGSFGSGIDNRFAMAFMGGGLTSAEIVTFNAIIENYLMAVSTTADPWLVYDDFTIKPNGPLGTPITGVSAWVSAAAAGNVQLALVRDGKCALTNETPNDAAAYLAQNLSTPVQEIRCIGSFNGGVSDYASIVQIASDSPATGTGYTYITNGKSIHVAWTDKQVTIGFYDGTGDGIHYYPVAIQYNGLLARDGTEYEFGIRINATTGLLTLICPDGVTRTIYDARVKTMGGNTPTVEPYKQDPGGGNNASNPRISKVWAK